VQQLQPVHGKVRMGAELDRGPPAPALAGVVESGRIDLAASCVGLIRPKSRLTLGERLGAGDAIVLLGSSGIHANGVSLARKLVARLPDGYRTKLADGTLYGEALLEPTRLYSGVTEALAAAGIVPHYSANITGHGWRKLMRHPGSFAYRIHTLPPVPPVLAFIADKAELPPRESYGSLNMGAGFALFVPAAEAQRCVEIARSCGVAASIAGTVSAGDRRIVIEPLQLTFDADELHVRA